MLALRRLPCAALLLVAVFVAPTRARAGGDFVDLAVGSARLWFVGEPGVREFDLRTRRTVSTPMLVRAAYPLSVALTDGAAWVASVENGYVWGSLSRIDTRTGDVRVVWRRADRSVQYVAAGADSVWALIGSARSAEIARFRLDGRLEHTWKIRTAGRMAADASGCWISAARWLLHIDAAGRLHRVVRGPLGDVAVGAGAVWVPRGTSLLRIDERSGRTRTLVTGRLRLGGFQHDVAAGANAVWVLQDTGRARTRVARFDARTGRVTGSVSVRGIGDAVVAKPDAVWVATVVAGASGGATGYDIVRIDAHTLRRQLFAHIL